MANRAFQQFQGTLETGVVKLFAKVTFGAAGAPTLVRGKGIGLVQRNGVGEFGFLFGSMKKPDNYQTLLACNATFLGTAVGVAPVAQVKEDDTAGATATVMFLSTAGAKTDPASGETVLIEFTLSNSSAY